MKTMTLHRAIWLMLFASLMAVSGLYQPRAHATASSTDQSDLWWNPSESGWGIQFVHQHSTIFATMFVYGPNGQPTWYIATMPAVGPLTYSGTIYVTQGPYFGSIPFNPAAVTGRPVGVMTFNVLSLLSGTLTYSVDGSTVTKQIQRQTIANQNFNGSFSGALNANYVSGDCHVYTLGKGYGFGAVITHNSAAPVAINFTTPDDTCSMPVGTYTQQGHFGRIQGIFACTSGDIGSMDIFEGNIAVDTVTARYQFHSTNTSCTYEGDFAGVRR